MAAIILDCLAKHYGDFVALDDLSLQVEQGEFLVLLGPSGCGKTTTLRIIGGFIEATRGRVEIGGRDVTHAPPYRRNIGLVFQNYALFPHLSVYENVAFGLRRRKMEEAQLKIKVGQALEFVQLTGFDARMPFELSGGQQQRVAIARAIAISPDILLLDEPLSNLDARLRLDVRDELRRLQSQLGITTLMVTHDQDEAMSIGDRLVVMQAGRVQQIGTPTQIYNHPANRFVASFIGKSNFFTGQLQTDGRFHASCGIHFTPPSLTQPCHCLLIRPERFRLSETDQGLANSFPVKLDKIVFLGAYFEVSARLGNEKVQLQIPAGDEIAPLLEEGRDLYMSIKKNDIIALQD